MNKITHSPYILLILLFVVYLFGPDVLSEIVNGMPLEEGRSFYSGNGLFYYGRDLDFYLEGLSFVSTDSIWRLMPMSIVLTNIQDLVFIGIFQIICLLFIFKFFIYKNRVMINDAKIISHSDGKSIQISLGVILGLGVLIFAIEIGCRYLYHFDFFFDNFINSNINQQKLNLHPLYFVSYFMVGCVGAAIFEEFFFRRVLFPLFRTKMPFLLSALLNSILFACLHEDLHLLIFIQTFICGMISCSIYENSKSIVGCILFHFAGNFFLLVLPLFYSLSQFH